MRASVRRLSSAEARYIAARAGGVYVSSEFTKAAEMADGEVLYCMGRPEDDVVRMRTETVIRAPGET